MFYIPLTTTPVGWLVLGIGGYALYRAGRKKGEEESAAALITEVPELETTRQDTGAETTND